MLYEVSTPAGANSIIDADNSRDAKIKTCKYLRIKPSDFWSGVSSMKARMVEVDFPETIYQPGHDEEKLQQLEGKDVLIYDEHHGTSIRIRKATAAAIEYYLDGYSTIIVI